MARLTHLWRWLTRPVFRCVPGVRPHCGKATEAHAQRLGTWLQIVETLETLPDEVVARALVEEVLLDDALALTDRQQELVAEAVARLTGTRAACAAAWNDSMLGDALVHEVWMEFPIMGLKSDVVAEVINRLRRSPPSA